MNELLQILLDWTAAHPYAFNAVVYCTALTESLVVLGLIIPGAAMLFGAGALIATGALPLYPILFWTIAGAITGDVLSFLLGHHYHQRLRVMWPFRRYPDMVNNGVDYFVRHGGKSVFLARFIGPLRPVVPAIAGMMNMSTTRFLVIDVIACLLWAPVYILPGVVFGASLGLAAEVAGRLVVLLVLLAALAWLGFWLAGNLVRFGRPHAISLMQRFLSWSRNHPHIRPLAGSLFDPDHPEARGLAVLSVLFFITLWMLLLISVQVTQGQLHAGIDALTWHGLERLHTPWADGAMVFIAQFGSYRVLITLLVCGLLWLLLKGHGKAAVHWLATCVCAGLLSWILHVTTRIPPPHAALGGYAFPDASVGLAIAVYGFLALLIARELPQQRRWLPYSIAASVVVPLAIARLYLGAASFSDVLAGTCLGMFWVALIGIAYDRHPAPRLPVRRMLTISTTVLVLAMSWQVRFRYPAELARHEPQVEVQSVRLQDWIESAWQDLPVWRIDLEGRDEQPLNVQWAGELDSLRITLQKRGWTDATRLSAVSAMNWLAPEPDINAMPVLPEVNDGRHQALLLVHPDTGDDAQLQVLRMWPSGHQLENGLPLWVGKVSSMFLETGLPLVSYLKSGSDYIQPAQRLASALGTAGNIELAVMQRAQMPGNISWQGEVLLAWEERPD